MSTAHFLYIPLVLLCGVILGFALASRAAKDAEAAERRREEARAARKRQDGAGS